MPAERVSDSKAMQSVSVLEKELDNICIRKDLLCQQLKHTRGGKDKSFHGVA